MKLCHLRKMNEWIGNHVQQNKSDSKIQIPPIFSPVHNPCLKSSKHMNIEGELLGETVGGGKEKVGGKYD
jgi:hypothetical protein